MTVLVPERRGISEGARRAILLIAVGAVFAAAGAVEWERRVARESHRPVPLPAVRTMGLALHGGILYSLDPRRRLLFALAADTGKVKAVYNFFNRSATGLAWGGNSFWSTDSAAGRIYRHNMDRPHTVRKAYSQPDRHPTAIFWDGSSLWVGDSLTEKIYRYSVGEALELVREYSLPGIAPADVRVAGSTLWVLDSITRRLYRYRLNAKAVPIDSLRLDPWLRVASKATGFAVDSSRLWLITEAPAELHAFELKALPWVPYVPKPGLVDY